LLPSAFAVPPFVTSEEQARTLQGDRLDKRSHDVMNSIIYIVGLVVVILAVLSFFGLR
jgi:hypothetical protein